MFRSTALVLAAHGSTSNPEGWLIVKKHVAALRQHKLFSSVEDGYYRQSPELGAVVRGVPGPRVCVVPFCMSEGDFARRVIPRLLGWNEPAPVLPMAKSRGAGWLHYTAPVGTHPRMVEVVIRGVEGMLHQCPAPVDPWPDRVSVVLVAHGAPRDSLSRRAAEDQALRMERRQLFASVRTAFLEERPFVSEVVGAARTPYIAVVPFFLSGGVHVRRDIPAALKACGGAVFLQDDGAESGWRKPSGRSARWIWCASGLGGEAALTAVVLDRVREAMQACQGPGDSFFSGRSPSA